MGAAGRRGELKKERVVEDHVSDHEEDGTGAQIISDPETWFDYWSEEIVETYHQLIDRCSALGLPFLDKAGAHTPTLFPEFVDFAFANSSKRQPPC